MKDPETRYSKLEQLLLALLHTTGDSDVTFMPTK
jgi:hypothetical protein